MTIKELRDRLGGINPGYDEQEVEIVIDREGDEIVTSILKEARFGVVKDEDNGEIRPAFLLIPGELK